MQTATARKRKSNCLTKFYAVNAVQTQAMLILRSRGKFFVLTVHLHLAKSQFQQLKKPRRTPRPWPLHQQNQNQNGNSSHYDFWEHSFKSLNSRSHADISTYCQWSVLQCSGNTSSEYLDMKILKNEKSEEKRKNLKNEELSLSDMTRHGFYEIYTECISTKEL